MSFRLGEGHSLRFLSADFVIVSNGRSVSTPVPEVTLVENIQLANGRSDTKVSRFPITSELQGGLLPPGSRSSLYEDFQNWQAFTLRLPVQTPDLRDFSIKFPAVAVDGRPVAIPDIRVERGTWTHVRTMC
jgi:hypothetical protein